MSLTAVQPRPTPLMPSRWPPVDVQASETLFPQAPAAAMPTLLLVDRRDPAISVEERRKLQASLSSAELERLRRYRLPEDADRFLLGRGLMRAWLAQLLGCGAAELPFTSLGHGKPAVAGAPHFNVSHSGELILLGLHADRAVGVDLEQDRNQLDWAAIARRYLGEAVVQRLQHDHPDEQAQRQAFLLEWCCLEARLKADGRGLSGLSELVGSAPDSYTDLHKGPWADGCWPLQLPEGYQGAAALQPADVPATAPQVPADQSPGLESRAGASDQASGGRASASTASGGIHIASP